MRRLCILLIRLYQITLSPMFNAFTGGHGSCRFRPTCSAYGIGAFRKHGTVKGFWLTLLRLLRCNPWGGSGWDPVPDTFRWNYWPKCDNEPVPGTEGNCDHGKEPKYSPRTRLRRM